MCVRRRRAAAPPLLFCARLPLPLLFFCRVALSTAWGAFSVLLGFLFLTVALAFRFCLKGARFAWTPRFSNCSLTAFFVVFNWRDRGKKR